MYSGGMISAISWDMAMTMNQSSWMHTGFPNNRAPS